jgi:DNA-directed RNA polymerase specialized sigma24 family protein
MFDSSLDRTIAWRLGLVCDHTGARRIVRRGIRNGIWFLDPRSLDEAPADDAREAPEPESTRRVRALEAFQTSGLFTPIELATLHALTIEKLSIGEVAKRDRCSRQAVMARLIGNSKRQGGILRKAREFHRHADQHALTTS